MTAFKKTLRRFGVTAVATTLLAVVGFQTAFGISNTAPQPRLGEPGRPQRGCAAGCVSASGWVRPVDAPIWGGFHNAENPQHEGVDLGAPKGTPIRAASAGRVVRVRCNVSPESWGCDQDGSSRVLGCGWYVDIAHAGNVYTRYCHQLRRPAVNVGDTVTVGQIIGVTGDSGNSGTPHLHFEVHIGFEDDNAVDPVAFMANHGAPLGTN
jgi:murein DD-endopeptidase MepM/ murein hydrolase activator NlpD